MKSKLLFLASFLGCLFLITGCGVPKTEELLNNTLKDDTTAYTVKENITIAVGLGEPSEYRILLSGDKDIVFLNTGDGVYAYETGKDLYSVTNYKKIDEKIERYYVLNSEEDSIVYKDKDTWYKKDYDPEKIFNKESFISLFKDKEAIEVTSGENKFYKLEAEVNLSDCQYLCYNDFLDTYKDAFTATITNYYDIKTKEYLMTKIYLSLDSDKMLDIYKSLDNPFGYEIMGFGLETNEIRIVPISSDFDILENYSDIIAEDIKDSSYLESIETVKNSMREDNKDGYYLDDNTFTLTEPKSLEHSWEYKENGEVILSYDKDTNTLTNHKDNTNTPDYIKVEQNSEIMNYTGKEVEEETLCSIWEAFFDMDISIDKRTLVGEGMKEEFYESDFANAVYKMYYEITVRELVAKMVNNDLSEIEMYAYIHLAEKYNIGLYDNNGFTVTFKDLYILCNHKESEYNEWKDKYIAFINENIDLGNIAPEELPEE